MAEFLPGMVYSDGIYKHTNVTFRGYDHTDGARDGDIYDMLNLTSDSYPLISTRERRHLLLSGSHIHSLVTVHGAPSSPMMCMQGEKLCKLTDDDEKYYLEEVATLSADKKKYAVMNGKLIIFPDKVMYDTVSRTVENLEARLSNVPLTFKDGMYAGEEAAANTI